MATAPTLKMRTEIAEKIRQHGAATYPHERRSQQIERARIGHTQIDSLLRRCCRLLPLARRYKRFRKAQLNLAVLR